MSLLGFDAIGRRALGELPALKTSLSSAAKAQSTGKSGARAIAGMAARSLTAISGKPGGKFTRLIAAYSSLKSSASGGATALIAMYATAKTKSIIKAGAACSASMLGRASAAQHGTALARGATSIASASRAAFRTKAGVRAWAYVGAKSFSKTRAGSTSSQIASMFAGLLGGARMSGAPAGYLPLRVMTRMSGRVRAGASVAVRIFAVSRSGSFGRAAKMSFGAPLRGYSLVRSAGAAASNYVAHVSARMRGSTSSVSAAHGSTRLSAATRTMFRSRGAVIPSITIRARAVAALYASSGVRSKANLGARTRATASIKAGPRLVAAMQGRMGEALRSTSSLVGRIPLLAMNGARTIGALFTRVIMFRPSARRVAAKHVPHVVAVAPSKNVLTLSASNPVETPNE